MCPQVVQTPEERERERWIVRAIQLPASIMELVRAAVLGERGGSFT